MMTAASSAAKSSTHLVYAVRVRVGVRVRVRVRGRVTCREHMCVESVAVLGDVPQEAAHLW